MQKKTKTLLGRVIVPIFNNEDILMSVPWVAFLDRSGGATGLCGATNATRPHKLCRNNAKWLYVHLDGKTDRLCTAHALGSGGIESSRRTYGESFRFNKWHQKYFDETIKNVEV